MIVIINIFKFRKWFKYGLKSKHSTAARPEGQKITSQNCYRHKQHALKGQKRPAQGNALGIMTISNAPCKGKSFENS